MIGGEDIELGGPVSERDLGPIGVEVLAVWPQAVFQDAASAHFFEVGGVWPPEFFVYRDDAIARSWDASGATPENDPFMLHFICHEAGLTGVVDSPDSVGAGIVRRAFETIRAGRARPRENGPLRQLLAAYAKTAKTPRELGTYFEELTLCYLRHEPVYRALYTDVRSYSDWAGRQGLDKRDTGIDLVAETITGDVHAIQCKFYPEDYVLKKTDIDSFFTASGKRPFSRRIIVTTTSHWSEHAEEALRDQQTEATKIDLAALETSLIDWSRFAPGRPPVLKTRKELRPHQKAALGQVRAGLAANERGKLIMACGTGKTFTSLKIAEEHAGKGKRVLFLVPSLALLSQSLTEWTQESATPLHNFAVCSDSDVGKKRKKDDDTVQTFVHELRYPATTHAERLAKEMKKAHDAAHMSVVYSTYHSIDVVHRAQHEHGLPAFDLVICDEAHRTTGAKFEGEDESEFVRVHDAEYLRATKRLYMTATPRIYADTAKATAERDKVALCSMDDEALFGPQLYLITFSEAVKRGLLVDYKVIVLSIEESHVSRRIQGWLKDENNALRVDDAAKIIGCWKALSKHGLHGADVADSMKRAVAFCQVIDPQPGARVHKVSSKSIADMFAAVVDAYRETSVEVDDTPTLRCEAAHVDGRMNATEKEEKIDWLKAEPGENTCRVLSNVRCLSEGVDVPALDAVLFLTPRSSQIDVVQSVGRVMRTAPGKKLGYVVLPVVIPAGMEPHEALNDNQTYKVVWQVLQALRSHDDRFDAMVNKLDLIGQDRSKMEVIAITDKVSRRPRKPSKSEAVIGSAKAGRSIGASAPKAPAAEQRELEFEIGEVERAIYAKLVQKVGNRHHWEDWAKDIAQIARTHIDRIRGVLENPANVKEREAFGGFADELRDDLNDSITDDEVIEMLAQHLVTKPVFEALFSGHSFASQNPISVAMQDVLEVLQEHRLEKEADTLARFYDSVKLRAEGIESAEGKQKIIIELYDKFFRNAFPKMSERLGIVYTPVEIVDFILHSVQHILETEFRQTLGSKGVHILDPFTGTGTFITRLIQSGLIDAKDLPHKFKHEIHANEVVLLAYYIAAINIEAAYHGAVGGDYQPFEGICLTDTFQLYEKEDLISNRLENNSTRRKKQKNLDIRVIIGNPPYSDGQDSANDLNDNVEYPHLDARIRGTYADRSSIRMVRSLYNSYIRAFRWASDRIGNAGVVGFVTNAGYVDALSADGFRRCLAEEFTDLYVFHLRGNQRTRGELSKREGGKVFGSGSRAPVAISILVKNPSAAENGRIFFRDVGDFLSREAKLAQVESFASVGGIAEAGGWRRVNADAHGDWLRQRDVSFGRHITLGSKKGAQDSEPSIFAVFSNGVKSNRDAWVFNCSRKTLGESIARMTAFFNEEAARFAILKSKAIDVDAFIRVDRSQISWADDLKRTLEAGRTLEVDSGAFVRCLYRPFTKQWLYMDRRYLWSLYLMPRMLPPAGPPNRLICLSGSSNKGNFSCIMTDVVPSLHVADIDGSQCFPLMVMAGPEEDSHQPDLFEQASVPMLAPGITDGGLGHFASAYPGEVITKDDLFYHVYGILHSADYRERYADNLGKELPRIPRVRAAADFWAFSKAGRALGELHVGYEEVPEHPVTVEISAKRPSAETYRVESMRFGKGEKLDGKATKDKTIVVYNDLITVKNIPLDAYEYVINGKSAIEWVMERQGVSIDKASGIVKDANDYALETMNDPRYPLSLLLRVITVSLETVRIVKGLPPLDVRDDG